MSDWIWPAALTVAVLVYGAGATRAWRTARATVAFVVTIPLAFLVMFDGLTIWYAASGGYTGISAPLPSGARASFWGTRARGATTGLVRSCSPERERRGRRACRRIDA